jgi:formylglycine-generating enzyme required for sulfatase activity
MPVTPGYNTANFAGSASWDNLVGNVTTVGSNGGPSSYGTYDQAGQVYEWNDLDGIGGSVRGLRGGDYSTSTRVSEISSSLFSRIAGPANSLNFPLGFRIASSYSILNPLYLSNFVNITDTNNAYDTVGSFGVGNVSYQYAIGKYLVTNSEYVEFLNYIASTDTYGLFVNQATFPIVREGTNGNYIYSIKTNYDNKPVIFINWFSAARYINWLHNGKPNGDQNSSTTEDGAYTLSGRINGNAVSRNAGAKYHIPTENEWYKAAYYKGGGTDAGYWKYATQSDADPTPVCANSIGDGIICGSIPETPTPTPSITVTSTPTLSVTPTPTICDVDPYSNNVSLLLYFDGSNGSRNIVDSSAYNHQITTEGNAIISTDLSKFGNSSLFLDGSGDYITLPSDNSFSFGTDDFTVECWIYIVQYGSYQTQILTTTGIFTNFSFAVDNNGKLFYWNGSIGRPVGSFGDVPLNQWTHVAFSRENQTIRLYVNERLVGSLNDSANLINTADICIGVNETYPYSNICYLDELRVTKGVARYVADTLQQYCSHYINSIPTPTPTPTPSPTVTRTPTVTPTITPSPTAPSVIVLPSQTKDELVIQLKDLVVNHKYKITLISDDSSSLDQSEFNFYATSSIKNIRTILVKNIFSKIVNVQILINDLTTETITSYPTFVKCYDYSECSVSCLSGYTYVDAVQNYYRFTFTNNMRFFHPDVSLYKLGYGFGQYVLKNIPNEYPMAILNKGYESFITYYGDNSKAISKTVDGVLYNFYYGDIGIQVNGVGPVPPLLSYMSYNNGYMGGQDRLIFNASCAVVTPTPTVTPTITPTVTRTPTPTPMFGIMSVAKPLRISWDE